jgi:hypothetical protein
LTLDGQLADLTPHERKGVADYEDGIVDPTTFPSILRLAIGARVALTENLDYAVGTYNGASGTLVALEYETNITDQALRLTYDQVLRGDPVPPIPIALVRFDSMDHKNPDDPHAHTCDENLGGNVVPVFPEDHTIVVEHKRFVRRQLPLVQARANTIHKAQGRSVDNLVYAPQRPFGPGQAYVALSRVTNLQGMYVIENDSNAELPLVDVNESLFTAFNDQLNAVDREMIRLRGLNPPALRRHRRAPLSQCRAHRPRRQCANSPPRPARYRRSRASAPTLRALQYTS